MDEEQIICGHLRQYIETGLDGIEWLVVRDGAFGYDSLVLLDDGDLLKILDEDGETATIIEIEKDYKSNLMQDPYDFSVEKQSVLGFWVRWLQKDVDPLIWMNMFEKKLRVRLVKNRAIS